MNEIFLLNTLALCFGVLTIALVASYEIRAWRARREARATPAEPASIRVTLVTDGSLLVREPALTADPTALAATRVGTTNRGTLLLVAAATAAVAIVGADALSDHNNDRESGLGARG